MKSTVLATSLATLLLTPAAASAAALTVGVPCAASGDRVSVTGAGFPPDASVSIDGDAFGSTRADAAGNFVTDVGAPFVSGAKIETVAIQAKVDGVALAAATFPTVAEAYTVVANLSGNPRGKVTWRFAGFPTGEPVYGHFRFKGKTYSNYRYGTAKGPCGTLSARARRLPVRVLRYGTWKLKFDASKRYSTKTPGRLGTISVFRTFRRG